MECRRDIFKLVFEIEGIKKAPILVRLLKNEKEDTITNDTLKDKLFSLGLEQVSLSEVLPKYSKVPGYLVDKECSICHSLYKENERYRNLKCEHGFHKKCIDKWLKNNPNCPICRSEII